MRKMLGPEPPMRRLLVLLALGALVASGAAPAAEAKPPKKKPCPVSVTAATVVTSQLAVYTTQRGRDFKMIGCDRKTRRRTVIDRWYSCECSIADEYPPTVWTAGRYVATQAMACSPIDHTDCYGHLEVINLRTPKLVSRTPDRVIARDVILKPNGSVAYTTAQWSGPYSQTIVSADVYVMERGGEARLLDSGATVEPGSLALSQDGKRLFWLNGDQARTAPFN